MNVKSAIVTFGQGYGFGTLIGVITGYTSLGVQIVGLILSGVAFAIWLLDGSCKE